MLTRSMKCRVCGGSAGHRSSILVLDGIRTERGVVTSYSTHKLRNK